MDGAARGGVLQAAAGTLPKVVAMNPTNRPAKPAPQAQDRDARPRKRTPDDGTNAVRHRPDPKAEPIPDGEHKYVPRSPYRTGNY
jgi:hypothetical protein